MRRVVVSVVWLALTAVVPIASAQVTTGNITGVVTDESNASLPGVTITLRSDAVPGAPTAVTSEAGVYRFPSLPPGRYELTYELSGFSTLRREEIVVALGGTTELNIQLKVSQVAETITVTGESPVVDTTSTEVSTNYNREWVENAPVRRFTFFDLINAAPGVSSTTSTSSRSQSFGSSTNENSYQLDGTDFTAPSSGAAWPWPNTDAIEEVQVLSLGASAEYGNLAGAVFNVVTRQGSNRFRGDANYYFQTDGLTGRNTDDDQDNGEPYHRARFRDFTGQLGGPAIKDKFWFFGSFQYQEDHESQPGTPSAFPARSDAKRVFFKVNYQFNPDNKIQFQYHDDYYRIPQRATAVDAPSSVSVENGHNPSPGIVYTSVINSTTVVEARYSGFYGKDHGDPLEDSEPRVKTRFKDLDTGRITGGIYSWYDGTSEKTAFAGKISKYADNFLGGNHDFKVGVQYNSGGSDYLTGNNTYIYTYGTTPDYGYIQQPFHEGGWVNALGIYADDTFRLGNRLSLNLGVRYDWSKASIKEFPVVDLAGNETGGFSPAIDKLFAWNVISPRLGVNYKLTPSGSAVLKGHYGRYHRSIVTSEFDDVGPGITPRFIFDGVFDAAGNPIGAEVVTDNTKLAVDPDLSNPFTDQFIIGYEQELVRDLGFSVNYVHKRGRDHTAFLDVTGQYTPFTYVDNVGQGATGQSVTLFRLVSDPDNQLFMLSNDDRMFTRYNGVNFSVNKRMSNRWQATFGLTLQKSEGRTGSSFVRSSPINSEVSTAPQTSGAYFGQSPNDFVNTEGRLIGDRPVVIKTQLVYEAPYGITVAGNFAHFTGRPWGRDVRPGIQGIRYLGEPFGERRLADLNQVDVRIQKEFRFASEANVAFFGDFLNLFNSDAYENVLSRLGTSSTFGVPSRFIIPRRLMLGAKVRF